MCVSTTYGVSDMRVLCVVHGQFHFLAAVAEADALLSAPALSVPTSTTVRTSFYAQRCGLVAVEVCVCVGGGGLCGVDVFSLISPWECTTWESRDGMFSCGCRFDRRHYVVGRKGGDCLKDNDLVHD